MLKNNYLLVLILTLGFAFNSCVDDEFDVPPLNGEDPDIQANATLDDVKAFLSLGNITKITDDLIIKVVVTADDESGNFFRTIIVEDESGGISLLINDTELYNRFPVGRRLFINCKDLHIGDYEGLPQLGGNPFDDDGEMRIGGISTAVLDNFIFPGMWGIEVVPKPKTLDQLGTSDLNTLVQLENIQFTSSSANQTYADAENQFSVNHMIQDCNGQQMILRSSGFSNFANDITPGGNGTLTAVYTIFRNDEQLIIRDPSDVVFEGDRCGTGGSQISIQVLKDAFNGGASNAPGGFIQGVVISDFQNGNVTGRNLFIQEGEVGIVVRFLENHSYALGDEIKVNVSGMELSEFNGLLQVNNVPLDISNYVGPGTLPTPRTTTIADIFTNAEVWESTVVKLENVTLSGSSTFDGGLDVMDATGSIRMFSRSSSTFANDAVPSGEVTLTAVVTQFNTTEIFIRNRDDVEGGTTTGGGDGIDENFQSLSDDQDVNLSGWTNVAVQGTRLWRAQEFSGNVYAQATSFSDDSPDMEAWLVTPSIDLEKYSILRFQSAKAFWDHDGLTVFISTDFSGDVGTASWTELSPVLAGSSDDDHAWIDSGDVDLSSFSGEAYIAFRYIGNNSTEDTSYRIDNVVVE